MQGFAHLIITDPDVAGALWEAARSQLQNLSAFPGIFSKSENPDVVGYLYISDRDAVEMIVIDSCLNSAQARQILEQLPPQILCQGLDSLIQVRLRSLQANGESFPVQMIIDGVSQPIQRLAKQIQTRVPLPTEKSSGPGELHPQALTDPDGKLALHPALMIQSPVESPSATKRTDEDRVARTRPSQCAAFV